jgi:hypothetical protein
VADRGGDLADGRQALGVRQLVHRGLQVGVGVAQVDFHLLALGDVRDHADDVAFAVGRPDQRLAGDDPVLLAGGVGERLLVFVGSAGLQDDLVLGLENARLLGRHEIEVGAPDQLRTRAAEKGAERIVHDDEAVLFILHEQRIGDGIDDMGEHVVLAIEIGQRGDRRIAVDEGDRDVHAADASSGALN